MSKHKYYIVRFEQDCSRICNRAGHELWKATHKLSDEERRIIGKPVGEIFHANYEEITTPLVRLFPELRHVELLGKQFEDKAKYDIKSQAAPTAPEETILHSIPAKNANKELKILQTANTDSQRLFWLELDPPTLIPILSQRYNNPPLHPLLPRLTPTAPLDVDFGQRCNN